VTVAVVDFIDIGDELQNVSIVSAVFARRSGVENRIGTALTEESVVN